MTAPRPGKKKRAERATRAAAETPARRLERISTEVDEILRVLGTVSVRLWCVQNWAKLASAGLTRRGAGAFMEGR